MTMIPKIELERAAAVLAEIVVEAVPEGGEWDGIRDRLERAGTVA